MNLAIQGFGVGRKSRKRSPHTVFHSKFEAAYRKDIGQEYLKFYNFLISYSL